MSRPVNSRLNVTYHHYHADRWAEDIKVFLKYIKPYCGDVLRAGDIGEYIKANEILSDLYKKNAIVHTCVDSGISMDSTVDYTLMRIIQALVTVNDDMADEMVRMQAYRSQVIVVERKGE